MIIKKRGSWWQCNYSISDRTNGLIVLKSLHFTSLQVKEKKNWEIFCFFTYIWGSSVCRHWFMCLCVRWVQSDAMTGGYVVYFFFFFFSFCQSACNFFASLFKNPLHCVLLYFSPGGSTVWGLTQYSSNSPLSCCVDQCRFYQACLLSKSHAPGVQAAAATCLSLKTQPGV